MNEATHQSADDSGPAAGVHQRPPGRATALVGRAGQGGILVVPVQVFFVEIPFQVAGVVRAGSGQIGIDGDGVKPRRLAVGVQPLEEGVDRPPRPSSAPAVVNVQVRDHALPSAWADRRTV